MAAIPDATLSVTDGALGLTEPTDSVSAVVGTCSAGTANTVYAFTDPLSVSQTLGTGPAVEAAAHKLAVGGGLVYVVPTTVSSTPGVAGSVTHSGTGLSVMTVSGAPYDAYQVIVKIVVGATNPAAGLATFVYTLDGGDNYSAETSLPTNGIFAITGTNLTITFSAASLVADDTYTFDCTAPGFNSTELTASLNALCADPRTWKFVHVVGSAATASAQATIATAVGTVLTAQEALFRYTYAILETPDLGDGTTGDSSLITGFSSFAHTRVCVCAGYEELTSIITGRSHKRSAAWSVAARRHKATISEDSMRVRSGALPGVTKLYRDEQINRGLDAARFTTLRTHVGKAGFYITRGRIMSATGSDFTDIQHREIMDVACSIMRPAMLEELGESVRVNPADAAQNPGAILPQEAAKIENRIRSKLSLALLDPDHVSDIVVQVNRTDNLISTRKLRIKARITPKGYFQFLEADMGFSNPKLEIG